MYKTNERDGNYLASTSEHNHDSNSSEQIRLNNTEFLKHKATSTNDKPSQIIQSAKANISTTAISCLPTVNAMKKVIKRTRKHELPSEPKNLQDR